MTPDQIRDYEYPGVYGKKPATAEPRTITVHGTHYGKLSDDDDAALQEGSARWLRHTVDIPTLRPVSIEAPDDSDARSVQKLGVLFFVWGLFCLGMGAVFSVLSLACLPWLVKTALMMSMNEAFGTPR